MDFQADLSNIKMILAIFLLLPSQLLLSQNIVPIAYDDTSVTISEKDLLVFSDSTNLLTALNIADTNQHHVWQNASKINILPNRTYWVKAYIRNDSDRDLDWLAYPGRAFVKEMYDLDSLMAGSSNFQENGRLIPYERRAVQGFANYANPFHLYAPKKRVKKLLFKIYSASNFYIQKEFSIRLETSDPMMVSRYFSNIFGAFVIGGLFIIIAYHICLYFFVRERMFLTFVGLLVSSALFFAYFQGFTIEFLWPNSPFWDIYCFNFILAANGILWIRFAQHYMDLGKLPKFWSFSCWIIQALHLVPIVMVLPDFFTEIPHPDLHSTATVLQTALMFGTEFFILTLSLAGLYYKTPGSSSFFLANFVPLLGGILLALQFLKIFPQQDWIPMISPIGYLVMAVVFSFGLGKRISRMKSQITLKQLETERLEREKEYQKKKIVEQKNNELAQKVIERTSEVTQQREEIKMQKNAIELQNKKLQELNKEKNHLISVVAHDLKSPLHQINGLMSILNHTIPEKSEDQNQLIEMVSTATNRLSTMVTSLLDINAIESGNANIKLEKTELSSIISDLIQEHAEVAKNKKISLTVSKPEFCFANLDRTYVHQALGNILSNAIKFSEKHGTVTIKLETKAKKVRFSVKDSGPGFSEADKPKMFKKFQRLSAQPTAGEHSTGLGLSIVKRFVEAMNGDVWCESKQGEGATFFVEFDAITAAKE